MMLPLPPPSKLPPSLLFWETMTTTAGPCSSLDLSPSLRPLVRRVVPWDSLRSYRPIPPPPLSLPRPFRSHPLHLHYHSDKSLSPPPFSVAVLSAVHDVVFVIVSVVVLVQAAPLVILDHLCGETTTEEEESSPLPTNPKPTPHLLLLRLR